MTAEQGLTEEKRLAAQRAARLHAMGGVLRDVGSDETGDGWGDSAPPTTDAADTALRREVPPHHGG